LKYPVHAVIIPWQVISDDGGNLLVPRHRRQLGHVLQQNASALQVEDAVLAPKLQLAVNAFAGGADKRQLFLEM
jgi:hypothetical protein